MSRRSKRQASAAYRRLVQQLGRELAARGGCLFIGRDLGGRRRAELVPIPPGGGEVVTRRRWSSLRGARLVVVEDVSASAEIPVP